MRYISKNDIIAALEQVGVMPGQVIYAQVDLRTPGLIKDVRDKSGFCQHYLDAFMELLGSEGTLVVPTYTTQVARYDIDFVWEETPSVLGIFPEHVRQHPESLRSIHPLHSVCAIGKNKDFVCGNNGTSDYGWNSPFHRLLQCKAKVLSIGLESGYAVGIVHHVDTACCMPWVYNKLLKWKPIVRGKPDPRMFTASVRYLDIEVVHELTPLVKHMRALGELFSAPLGAHWVHMSDYVRVFEEAVKALNKDPFFYLNPAPSFTYGKLPFDGPTAGRDGIGSAVDENRNLPVNWEGYYIAGKYYAGGD